MKVSSKIMSMIYTNAYHHLPPPPSHHYPPPPHHHHRTMFPGPLALLSGLFRGTMVGDTNTAREPSSFLLAVPIGREKKDREGDCVGYRDFIA